MSYVLCLLSKIIPVSNLKSHISYPENKEAAFLSGLFSYNCFSNFSVRTDFGTAPICLSTISPFLKNNNAGIFLIP